MRWSVKHSFWVILAAIFPTALAALPKHLEVSSGDVVFSKVDESTLEVTASDRASIVYESFSLNEGETIRYVQPKDSSILLNKVIGKEPSKILGKLESNGKIFLVNPNGVYFGPHAKVDVGSLVVSCLDLVDQDFSEDRFNFSVSPGKTQGSIVNLGSLKAKNEGVIALIAPHIRNEGVIVASAGKIVLAAGEKVALDFTGNGLMRFTVEGQMEKALIEQMGSLEALDGSVFLSMGSIHHVIEEVINLEGISFGENFIEENGVIYLAEKAQITASCIEISGKESSNVILEGLLDVSTLESKGGVTHIFGENIRLSGCTLEASGSLGGGEILVGGDFQGKGDVFQARTVEISGDSLLAADALNEGSGGRVAVWAKETTIFNGMISAKGGIFGGDGGYVETSGSQYLSVKTGRVDTSSFEGSRGTWLLDPLSIRVASGGDTSISLVDLSDGSDSSSMYTIDPSVITESLSNVVLFALGDAGGVTIEDPIFMSHEGVGLTISVNSITGAIHLNNDITTKGGSLYLEGPVKLGGVGERILDTTNSSLGASIIFTGRVDGSKNLLLRGGSEGEIEFKQLVGALNPLSKLTIESGANVFLSSNIVTSMGEVHITPPLILRGNTKIDTTYRGIKPLGASIVLDGAVNGNYKLFLDGGGKGTVTVGAGSSVGSKTALSVVQIRGAGIVVSGNITADGGTITFEGPVLIASDLVLTDTGPSGIFFMSTVNSVSGNHSLTLVAPQGRISFLDGVGLTTPLQNITASSKVTQIKSSMRLLGSFLVSAPVQLLSNITIQASTIHFFNTVDGSYNLTLNCGSSGVIRADNRIGEVSRLGALTITNTNTLELQGVYAGSITQTQANTTTFHEFLDTSGTAGISLNGGTFNFGAGITTKNGGGFSIHNAGNLTSTAEVEMNLSGAFSQTGAGAVFLAGIISTRNRDITITSPLHLVGPVSLNTSTSGDGSISLGSTVDGSYPFSLTAGIGDLTIAGDLGATMALGDIMIASARNISLQNIRAASLEQQKGFGRASYLGNIVTSDVKGINITSTYLEFAGSVPGKSLTTVNGNIIINGWYDGINTPLNPVEVNINNGEGYLFLGSAANAYFSSGGDNVKWIGSVRANIPPAVVYNGEYYYPKIYPIQVK